MAVSNAPPTGAKPAQNAAQARQQQQVTKDLALLTKQMKEYNESAQGEAEVRAALEKTLKNAITAQASENVEVRRQSVTAMKQVRQDLGKLTGDLAGDKEKFIELYDKVIKESERSTKQLSIISKDLRGKLTKAIPTLGTFTKAVIANTNPLLRIGLDVYGDLKKYRKDVAERADKDRTANLKALTEQSKLLKDGADAQKQAAAATEAATKDGNKSQDTEAKKAARAKKSQGPVVTRLEAVKAATDLQTDILKQLYTAFTGEIPVAEDRAKAEQELMNEFIKGMKEGMHAEAKAQGMNHEMLLGVLDAVDEELGQLKSLNDLMEYANGMQDKMVKVQEDQARQAEADRLAAVEAKKEGAVKDPKSSAMGLEKDKGGAASGLLAAFGGFIVDALGLGTFMSKIKGLGGITKGFGAALESVGGIAKVAGKVVKGVPIVGTVIGALEGIWDGLFNAEKILGKDSVDLQDRAAVAVSGFFASFVDILDIVGGWMGIDTKVGGKSLGDWTREIGSKGLSAVFHPIDTINEVLDQLGKAWDAVDMKPVMEQLGKLPGQFLDWLTKPVMQFAQSVAQKAVAVLPDVLVPEGLKQFASSGSLSGTGEVSEVANKGGVSKEIAQTQEDTKRIEQANAKSEAAAATVVAPTTNNVNAGTTNVFNAPLQTRSDDRSLRWNMGMPAGFAF